MNRSSAMLGTGPSRSELVRWTGIMMAATLAFTPGAASAAFNWCALPDLISSSEADFERIAPLVEGATGCKRKATGSAHDGEWACQDDPATPNNEWTLVKLLRTPGEGIHLMVGGAGLQSLDALRACSKGGVTDGTRFVTGNVAHRDQVTMDYGTKAITLINMGASSVGVAYTGRRFGADSFGEGVVRELFGTEPETYPTTAVKLAGADPLATDVFDLVAAFRRRGSSVASSQDLDESIPDWKLTPPTGLPGVTSVEITGFVRHLLHATYILAGVADYERYMALLDREYGTSRRSTDEGCAVRHWSAGRVTIVGRHCAKAGVSSIRFHNEVTANQLSAYVDKRKKDEAAKPGSDKPKIDRDNF